MNINEFKSVMNLFGGPLKTSLFVVEIGPLETGYISQGDLRFFCSAVDVPGFNLDTVPYKPQGFGMTEHITVGMSPDPLNCTFMLDSEHNVLSFFHEWIQKIINFNPTGGQFSEVNGMLPFEQGYKKDYSTIMSVKHYSSSDPNFFYKYTFYNVYPTLISGVNLNWADSEPFATTRVNFSYSGMSVNAALSGSPTLTGSRNVSFLEQLSQIGFYGYRQENPTPDNLQGTIDQLVNLNNTVNGLRRIFR